MSEREALQARILQLSREEMVRLRDWLLELDHQDWEEQIAADLKAGKLQGLVDQSREDFAQGKAREL